MSADEFPSFRAEVYCPKCEGNDVAVIYTQDGNSYGCWHPSPPHPEGEHFHRVCNRCHYLWVESVLS